jgi:hypothetical protein
MNFQVRPAAGSDIDALLRIQNEYLLPLEPQPEKGFLIYPVSYDDWQGIIKEQRLHLALVLDSSDGVQGYIGTFWVMILWNGNA